MLHFVNWRIAMWLFGNENFLVSVGSGPSIVSMAELIAYVSTLL